jgi:hypothetical protein
VPNFSEIGQEMWEVQVDNYLRPFAAYFHETWPCSLTVFKNAYTEFHVKWTV